MVLRLFVIFLCIYFENIGSHSSGRLRFSLRVRFLLHQPHPLLMVLRLFVIFQDLLAYEMPRTKDAIVLSTTGEVWIYLLVKNSIDFIWLCFIVNLINIFSSLPGTVFLFEVLDVFVGSLLFFVAFPYFILISRKMK